MKSFLSTRRRRAATAVLAALAACTASVAAWGAAAHADGNSYVVIGDSYSSGEGAGDYSASCDRSPNAYGKWFAQQLGMSDQYTNNACAGATVNDIYAQGQLNSLDGNTKVVTLTIGGNDLNFGGVMTSCGLAGECSGLAVDQGGLPNLVSGSKLADLSTKLIALYMAIKQKAPNAKIYVLGYPDIMPQDNETCLATGMMWQPAIAQFHVALQQTDATIKGAADASGVTYVDTTDLFVDRVAITRTTTTSARTGGTPTGRRTPSAIRRAPSIRTATVTT